MFTCCQFLIELATKMRFNYFYGICWVEAWMLFRLMYGGRVTAWQVAVPGSGSRVAHSRFGPPRTRYPLLFTIPGGGALTETGSRWYSCPFLPVNEIILLPSFPLFFFFFIIGNWTFLLLKSRARYFLKINRYFIWHWTKGLSEYILIVCKQILQLRL